MTATIDVTPWCVLATIKFTKSLPPCEVLSIHYCKKEAQKIADALSADERWSTTTKLLEYSGEVCNLKEGDYLLGHKIDVIMEYSYSHVGAK